MDTPNRSSLAFVDRIYQLCATRKITYHSTDHDLFRTFCQALHTLNRLVRENGTDEAWSNFFRSLLRYRFDVSAAPLPFNSTYVAPEHAPTLRSFASRAKYTYPQHANLVAEVVDAFFKLSSCSDNPLLLALRELNELERTFVIVRERRLVEGTQAMLSAHDSTRAFETIPASDASKISICDRIIILGAPRWFPDHMFSAPRAPQIDVVCFRWNLKAWRPTRVLLERSHRKGNEERVVEQQGELIDEPWPEPDWSSIVRSAALSLGQTEDSDAPELVDAQLFALQDDYAVFLEAKASALVIDLEEEEEARICRVEANEIKPGVFLLLRTEGGGGDYIVSMADRLLGARAIACRSLQKDWKRGLRAETARMGIQQTVSRLIGFGAQRADHSNLRNWMSDRSIRTHDKRDFVALMRLIDREAEADKIWQTMGDIDAMHRRAGKMIRRRLIEQVRDADLEKLEKSGRLDFVLPEAEGGRLTAFRVEARAPTIDSIPASRCARVFGHEDEESSSSRRELISI